MNEVETLSARVSDLEREVKRLEAVIEHVAQMITRYGIEDPGIANDELPLRDCVEELESQLQKD